jgi:hypothetical protein
MPKIMQMRSRTAMHELHSQQFCMNVEQIIEWMLPRLVDYGEKRSFLTCLSQGRQVVGGER